MDTTQALCLALVVSLYLVAVGGHVAERLTNPRKYQTPHEKTRQPRPAHVDLLLFKLLPTEIRHRIYRYLFRGTRAAFRPDVYTCLDTRCFSVLALLNPMSDRGTNHTPGILRVDRFLADDAMPVLLDHCWVEMRSRPRGELGDGEDGRLDYFNPAQLYPPWTHSIRYLTISPRTLRFLRMYNAPARLTGLQLVMCNYRMIVKSEHVVRPSRIDNSDREPIYGLDIEPWIAYDEDDEETWEKISAHEVNNITNSFDFKFRFQEFMVEMNELFPRCEQLLNLKIAIWHTGHPKTDKRTGEPVPGKNLTEVS